MYDFYSGLLRLKGYLSVYLMLPPGSEIHVEAGLGASIPPELFPLIIQHVDGYRTDLGTCSLVSRAWRKFAQRRIFSHLSLSQERECVAWNRKFEEHPHLALTVTHVDIYGGEYHFDIEIDESDPDASNRWDAVLDNDAATRLIRRLPNVVDLHVYEFVHWGAGELAAILLFKKIRSLEISSMAMPSKDFLEIVHSLTQLKFLSIRSLYLEESSEHMKLLRNTGDLLTTSHRELPDAPPHHLKSLTLNDIQCEPDLIMWLLSPRFDLGDLRDAKLFWEVPRTPKGLHLRVPQSPDHHAAFLALGQLINAIGPTVIDLVVTNETYSDPEVDDPCLRKHTYLLYCFIRLKVAPTRLSRRDNGLVSFHISPNSDSKRSL